MNLRVEKDYANLNVIGLITKTITDFIFRSQIDKLGKYAGRISRAQRY